jgi:hypothetical protein
MTPAKEENFQHGKPILLLRKLFAWIDLLSGEEKATVWIQTSEHFLSQLLREAGDKVIKHTLPSDSYIQICIKESEDKDATLIKEGRIIFSDSVHIAMGSKIAKLREFKINITRADFIIFIRRVLGKSQPTDPFYDLGVTEARHLASNHNDSDPYDMLKQNLWLDMDQLADLCLDPNVIEKPKKKFQTHIATLRNQNKKRFYYRESNRFEQRKSYEIEMISFYDFCKCHIKKSQTKFDERKIESEKDIADYESEIDAEPKAKPHLDWMYFSNQCEKLFNILIYQRPKFNFHDKLAITNIISSLNDNEALPLNLKTLN